MFVFGNQYKHRTLIFYMSENFYIFYIFQQSGVHRRQRCGMYLSEQTQQCSVLLTMSYVTPDSCLSIDVYLNRVYILLERLSQVEYYSLVFLYYK